MGVRALRILRQLTLQGILPIKASQVPTEIVAGMTLAAIAIPEVMGYTKIAGMPVITGLYTILVPAVVFAVFGSSRHLVVGADSATAAILAGGLAGLASTGSGEYVALASLLALLSAGLLLVARLVGLGFMADFLSRTVLTGFLTGVGIQVALGQLSGMLGLRGGGHGTLAQLWADAHQLGSINMYALSISVACLIVIVGARAISKRLPGALVAVIGAIAASWAFGLSHHVDVIGHGPGGLPRFGLPSVAHSWHLVQNLAPTAFALFVVILSQSAATSRAYAMRYDDSFDENADLVGLGLANLGAGLSGTFVINGSPTKTEMLDGVGGRTQLSLLVMAVVVLLVLLFLTSPLAYMPEAVLAAVVFKVGIDLIDVSALRRIYRQRRSEFWVAVVTLLLVVLVGVEQGIVVAIVLSLIDHTRHGYRPKNSLLTPDASGTWHPQPLASNAQAAPGLAVYRFTHSMYYANSTQLSEEVTRLVRAAKPPLRWLCIDASAIDDVDYTAAETLHALAGTLHARGIRLVAAEVQGEVMDESRHHLRRIFGEDAFFATLHDVLIAYRAQR